MQPMMRLPKSDARTTTSDRARIDRVEAAEERGRPWCAAGGVCDFGGVFGCGGGAGDPAVEVALHF